MKSTLLLLALCLAVVLVEGQKVVLKKGNLMLSIRTGEEPVVKHRMDITSRSKAEIRLTQSSKVDIDAEVTTLPMQIEFSRVRFEPQFLAFRLVHELYPNLTEPVLAEYKEDDGVFKVTLDMGDSRFIQPLSDTYALEILIGDDELDTNFRNIIAKFNIRFSKSLIEPPKSQFHYEAKKQIIFKVVNEKIDTPAIFTLFATALVVVSVVLFLYSLQHLKINLNSFPFNDPNGMLLNVAFLGCIGLLFFIIVQFWLSWTFIETVRVLGLFILPTMFIGNYALLRLKH